MSLRSSNFEELPNVNLTPMIDVVFLLIIFFMVGTQFTDDAERQIDINLPGVSNLKAVIAAPDQREVSIDSAGVAYLDGQRVTMEQLTQRLSELRRSYPDLAVAVRADGDAMTKFVIPVYAAIQTAGVTKTAVLGMNQNSRMR